MKRIAIILLFVFAFFLPIIAYAHPGDTDENGGHYDHSTGEYHYHHGYPAHQHPNGICPYDYDDRTGENSGSHSSSSSTMQKAGFAFPTPSIMICGGLGILVIVATLIIFHLKANIYDSEYHQKELDKEISSLRKELKNTQALYNQAKSESDTLHGYISDLEEHIKQMPFGQLGAISEDVSSLTTGDIFKLAGVPNGVTFDNDYLPHYYSIPSVERNMHVYICKAGACYHRQLGCCGANREIHLFIAAENYRPCKHCIPDVALDYKIPDWYYRYLQLIAVAQRQNQAAGSAALPTSADRREA